MKSLNRFTQSGNLTLLFAVILVLYGDGSTALTTFGKIKYSPPATPAPFTSELSAAKPENLESLVKTMIAKQDQLLAEIYELKQQNSDFHFERIFQMMDRRAMMREIDVIKTLLGQCTKVMEETADFSQAVQDANENIVL